MNIYGSKFKTFGSYTDQILGYANETFSVLHRKFLKEVWGDNRITAKLRHNQCHTNWQDGTYEVYIPTRDNVDNNLSYYRIALKVLPYVSNSDKREQANKLENQNVKPMGIIESELLILIAPRQDRWGLVRGFKHVLKPGYFTAIFVNKSPTIVWKRVMDRILNFVDKRLDGLMTSLGFETWVWKWILSKRNRYCSNIRILERFSFVIQQSFETLLLLFQHFMDKLKAILREIGAENVACMVLQPLKGVGREQLATVFTIVRERLGVQLIAQEVREHKGLRYLEALKVNANG